MIVANIFEERNYFARADIHTHTHILICFICEQCKCALRGKTDLHTYIRIIKNRSLCGMKDYYSINFICT